MLYVRLRYPGVIGSCHQIPRATSRSRIVASSLGIAAGARRVRAQCPVETVSLPIATTLDSLIRTPLAQRNGTEFGLIGETPEWRSGSPEWVVVSRPLYLYEYCDN